MSGFNSLRDEPENSTDEDWDEYSPNGSPNPLNATQLSRKRDQPAAVVPPAARGYAVPSPDCLGISDNGEGEAKCAKPANVVPASTTPERKPLRARRTSIIFNSAERGDAPLDDHLIEVGKLWYDILLRYGGLTEEDSLACAQILARAKMPVPSSDANSYLTHEFLRELGITKPGMRAKVKLACHRMPDIDMAVPRRNESLSTSRSHSVERGGHSDDGAMQRLSSGVFNSTKPRTRPSTCAEDPNIVTLETFINDSRSVTWHDLRGRDGVEVAPLFDDLLHRLKAKIAGVDEAALPPQQATTIDRILALELPLPQMVIDPQSPSEFAFVLRVCTWNGNEEDDSVRELTNRWTLYVNQSKQTVVTIHRVDNNALADMRDSWEVNGCLLGYRQLIVKILERFLSEFDVSLTKAMEWLDTCEEVMLASTQSDSILRRLFHLQRRASVYDRMVDLSHSFVIRDLAKHMKMQEEMKVLEASFRGLKERCVDLQQRSQNLLEIHLSLIGNHNNGLFAVLTKFSMLFAPLTFVATVNGMNFIGSTMFLMEETWGYYANFGIYAVISIIMILWIKFGIMG